MFVFQSLPEKLKVFHNHTVPHCIYYSNTMEICVCSHTGPIRPSIMHSSKFSTKRFSDKQLCFSPPSLLTCHMTFISVSTLREHCMCLNTYVPFMKANIWQFVSFLHSTTSIRSCSSSILLRIPCISKQTSWPYLSYIIPFPDWSSISPTFPLLELILLFSPYYQPIY